MPVPDADDIFQGTSCSVCGALIPSGGLLEHIEWHVEYHTCDAPKCTCGYGGQHDSYNTSKCELAQWVWKQT